MVRGDFDVRLAPACRAAIGLETAAPGDVVRREDAIQPDGRVNRAGYRHGLAVGVLDDQGRDAAAEARCERALGAAYGCNRNNAVVDSRVDDQRRVAIERVAAGKRGKRIAHTGIVNFHAMPALR